MACAHQTARLKGDAWAIALSLLLAGTASANSGSPLLITGLLHLTLGNLLIGVAEGVLLAIALRCPPWPWIGWMILANYCSAWAGWLLLWPSGSGLMHGNLYALGRVFAALVAASFALTLLVEWPFVWLLVRRQRLVLRRALFAFVVVQLASYAALAGIYLPRSELSLLTQVERVEPEQLLTLPGYACAYIDARDGNIWRISLGGGPPQHLLDAGSTSAQDRLLLLPGPRTDGKWNLLLQLDQGKLPPILRLVMSTAAPVDSAKLRIPERRGWADAVRLDGAVTDGWDFVEYPLSGLGLRGRHDPSGRRVTIGFGTPVMGLRLSNAIHLPGPLVVFQLGDRQICLFDAEKRQVARLAWGRGPAVFPTP